MTPAFWSESGFKETLDDIKETRRCMLDNVCHILTLNYSNFRKQTDVVNALRVYAISHNVTVLINGLPTLQHISGQQEQKYHFLLLCCAVILSFIYIYTSTDLTYFEQLFSYGDKG